MCKKVTLLALMISICMLSACRPSYLHDEDMDIYEKIHRYYNEMESYSSDLTITAYSNKTENTYHAVQKSTGHDKFYMQITSDQKDFSVTTVENSGIVKTTTDGSAFSVTMPTREGTGLLFVNRFFAKYYASEDTVLLVNGRENGSVTVLETALSENNPRFATATLTVDNQTLAPVRIELADRNGNTILKGEFSHFIYNDTIEEHLFSTNE